MRKDAFQVFYSGFDEDFHLEAIDQLKTKHNWEPVYFVGNQANEQLLSAKYPKAIFHSDLKACRGLLPDKSKSIETIPLDKQLLHDLAPYHHIVITMMDRMDPGDYFSYRERVELFYNLAAYWNTVLLELKPDLVVFHLTPHLVYDFVLYALCEIHTVKTMMFNPINVDGMYYLCEKYNGISPIARTYHKLLESSEAKRSELSPHMKQYVEKVRDNYERGAPSYLGEKRSKEKIKIKSLPIFNSVKSTVARHLKKDGNKFRQSYLKRSGKPITDPNWTISEYNSYKSLARKEKNALKDYYDSISKKFDQTQKFIYVPLQYQPEKTTSPEAGFFVDQFLMIELLSKSIPDDWVIYVKEHTVQFFEIFHGERSAKDRKFYDKLKSIKNVTLIDLNTNPFDLIDHSQACCTTTGTVGWEAVLRGKPTLLFGYPWYRGCEGTFMVNKWSDCKEAIDKIRAGYEVDGKKVELYLHAILEYCQRGYIYGRLKDVANIDYSENVERLIKAMVDFDTVLNSKE